MLHPLAPLPAARRRARGSTLVVAVFVIAILAAFIGLALDYTTNTAVMMRHARDLTNATALANGALEATYQNWRQYMAARQFSGIPSAANSSNYTSVGSLQAIADALKPTLQTALSSTGFTLSSLKLTPVDRKDAIQSPSHYSGTTVNGVVTDPGSGTKGPLGNVPGWVATSYTFRAQAVVAKSDGSGLSITISRYFQQSDASLFQAMLFFQDDLELHPGPNMTLYGLVHTNSNMYTAAGSGGGLTFKSKVSFHGNEATLDPATTHPSNFYQTGPANTNGIQTKGYVEGVTQTLYTKESGNWNSYLNPVYGTDRNSQLSQVDTLDPLGTNVAGAVDANNPNASGTHEIIERPVPNSKIDPNASGSYKDPDAFAAHRIFNSAGLRVIVNRSDATQKVRIYKPSPSNPENSVELGPTGSALAKLQIALGTQTDADAAVATGIIAAVTPDSAGSIYDFREGRTINADTVDVSTLTPALNAYAAYNGVVYITDATNADVNGNTGNSDAIRLKKGGTLPGTTNGTPNASGVEGLTVATDGALYVQGDYNTGTTYGADGSNNVVTTTKQPASNATSNADPTQFNVSGYTQKPAAVLGDAVMILSNAWADVGSSSSLSSRNATPTTMNAAIASGQVLTSSAGASGGAHNFPRFLENWSGDNFTYHGSMCELYASTHFTGTYGKANVYSPPNRRWYFDDNFVATPPPGNLRSTTYKRGRWVRE